MSQTRQVGLGQWLSTLPGPSSGHRLVGGTGHLLLDATERRNVENRLDSEIFPLLFSSARHVTIATGAAPGADLLFARTAQRWLTRAGVSHELVALMPVSLEALLDDWSRRVSEDSLAPDPSERATVRQSLRALLAQCSAIVDLRPGTAGASSVPTADRYRQLAAVLAEQSDLLVAILRATELQRPGGTAEVVDWRRHPDHVPAALSTLALRRPSGDGSLWVIDPQQTVESRQAPVNRHKPDASSISERRVVVHAREALADGNYLRCYDLVRRVQADGMASRELTYLALLALANAGSTDLALARYRDLVPADSTDEDWLALEGRLLKDQAAVAPADQAGELYRASARAYYGAFERTGGRYPALNAATMYLLAGETEAAMQLARNILADIDTSNPVDEVDDYYCSVTEAEAALLLEQPERAHLALERADRCLRGNLNVRSRSLAQLRLICRDRQIAETVLEPLRLPPVVQLRDLPARSDAVSVLEALTRERAIVFVELIDAVALDTIEPLLHAGLRVHLMLADGPAVICERWRRYYDSATVARLQAALAAAHDVSSAQGFIDGEDAWCRDYVASMAQGLSQLLARRLGCRWQALTGMPIADAAPATPETTGSPRYGRRCIGTLFTDFVGFSRLDDDELPVFWDLFTGLVEQLVQRHAGAILYHRTWGDALHVVAVDAGSIADIAFDLRSLLETLQRPLSGALARLELRLAAHYAPAYVDGDAASGSALFFGSQLSFAARVEPVTPPGSVFVTEAFAARLALEAGDRHHFDYAGEIDLPKAFGKYRLFGLQRASARA